MSYNMLASKSKLPSFVICCDQCQLKKHSRQIQFFIHGGTILSMPLSNYLPFLRKGKSNSFHILIHLLLNISKIFRSNIINSCLSTFSGAKEVAQHGKMSVCNRMKIHVFSFIILRNQRLAKTVLARNIFLKCL